TAATAPPRTKVEGAVLHVYPGEPLQGAATLALETGIRSNTGANLKKRSEHAISLPELKPGVRFVGKGTILPSSDGLTIPFEAANVKAVQVTAFEVFEDNLGQFLQVNGLEGESELARVGRHLWRKTLALDAAKPDQWNRFAIDATPLFAGR